MSQAPTTVSTLRIFHQAEGAAISTADVKRSRDCRNKVQKSLTDTQLPEKVDARGNVDITECALLLDCLGVQGVSLDHLSLCSCAGHRSACFLLTPVAHFREECRNNGNRAKSLIVINDKASLTILPKRGQNHNASLSSTFPFPSSRLIDEKNKDHGLTFSFSGNENDVRRVNIARCSPCQEILAYCRNHAPPLKDVHPHQPLHSDVGSPLGSHTSSMWNNWCRSRK